MRYKFRQFIKRMRDKIQSQLTDQSKYQLMHQEAQVRSPKSTMLYRYAYLLKGLLGCIGGLMIHLVIGSLYQWGLLNPYITSYFILNGYDNLSTKDTVIIFPIMMFCIGVTMKVGLMLGHRFGYVRVLCANFMCCSLFVFGSSYTSNILLFVVLYSLGFGLMAGMTFMVPMRVCNDYFPNKQTYVNGFILIGTGLGSVVFGLFSINFLNPDKLDPIDGLYVHPTLQHITDGVPSCVRYLSVLYLGTGLVGSLLLLPLEDFNKDTEKMEKTIISHTMVQKLKNDTGHCLSNKEAILSKVFWMHILIIILGSCGNLFINTNYKLYASDTIHDDQFLTLVGLLGSVGNGMSRFFWSSLFNRIGYKLIMMIMLGINIICLGTIRLTVQTKEVYLLLVFVFNCTLGGMLVVAPTYSAVMFGKDIGAQVFGVFWCSFAVGNFLQYTYLLTLQSVLSLDGIIYVCLAMNLINVLVIILYGFKAPWGNDAKYFKFSVLPRYQLVKDDEELLIYSVVSNRLKNQQLSSYIQQASSIIA